MSDKLKIFLTSLATDSELVQSFEQDKEGTMKAHGVEQEHIDLVIQKKYSEIENLLGADYEIAKNGVISAFKK